MQKSLTHVNKKFDVILLYYNMIYLNYSLIYLCLLYFKLIQWLMFLLYSKSVLAFLVPILTIVHLFGDLLLSALMNATLM